MQCTSSGVRDMRNTNEIIKSIPGTLIVDNAVDNAFKIYEEHLLKSQHEKSRNYGHSLIYFLQSARNFWAYNLDQHEETLLTITTKHPNGKPPFVIVYPIGKSPQLLAKRCFEVATLLKELTGGERVILKKIPKIDFEIYKNAGFSEYLEHDGWSVQYRFDDDEFPEFVIDIPLYLSSAKVETKYQLLVPFAKVITSNAQVKDTLNLRGHIRRFGRWLDKEDCTFEVRPYDPDLDWEAVKVMIEQWAKFRRTRHRTEELNDLIESHLCFLKGLATLPTNSVRYSYFNKEKLANSFVMRICKQNFAPKVVGFGFFGVISQSTIGIYAELALHQRGEANNCKWETINETGVPGCSEVLVFQMLEAAYKHGLAYANLGGAESKKLDESRTQKFPQNEKNCMGHLVLY